MIWRKITGKNRHICLSHINISAWKDIYAGHGGGKIILHPRHYIIETVEITLFVKLRV